MKKSNESFEFPVSVVVGTLKGDEIQLDKDVIHFIELYNVPPKSLWSTFSFKFSGCDKPIDMEIIGEPFIGDPVSGIDIARGCYRNFQFEDDSV